MESLYDTQALTQSEWDIRSADLLAEGWEPLLPPRAGVIYIRKYIEGRRRAPTDWRRYDVNG